MDERILDVRVGTESSSVEGSSSAHKTRSSFQFSDELNRHSSDRNRTNKDNFVVPNRRQPDQRLDLLRSPYEVHQYNQNLGVICEQDSQESKEEVKHSSDNNVIANINLEGHKISARQLLLQYERDVKTENGNIEETKKVDNSMEMPYMKKLFEKLKRQTEIRKRQSNDSNSNTENFVSDYDLSNFLKNIVYDPSCTEVDANEQLRLRLLQGVSLQTLQQLKPVRINSFKQSLDRLVENTEFIGDKLPIFQNQIMQIAESNGEKLPIFQNQMMLSLKEHTASTITLKQQQSTHENNDQVQQPVVKGQQYTSDSDEQEKEQGKKLHVQLKQSLEHAKEEAQKSDELKLKLHKSRKENAQLRFEKSNMQKEIAELKASNQEQKAIVIELKKSKERDSIEKNNQKELNRIKFENKGLVNQKRQLQKNTKKAKDLFTDTLAVKMQYEELISELCKDPSTKVMIETILSKQALQSPIKKQRKNGTVSKSPMRKGNFQVKSLDKKKSQQSNIISMTPKARQQSGMMGLSNQSLTNRKKNQRKSSSQDIKKRESIIFDKISGHKKTAAQINFAGLRSVSGGIKMGMRSSINIRLRSSSGDSQLLKSNKHTIKTVDTEDKTPKSKNMMLAIEKSISTQRNTKKGLAERVNAFKSYCQNMDDLYDISDVSDVDSMNSSVSIEDIDRQ